MAKILFIRVNIYEKKSSDALQPLVFAILDALTPLSYEREYIDDCIEDVDFNIKADIVAFTFGTYAAKRAYAFAQKFKQNGATIIMGGFHVTAMPEEAMEHADAVITGDAEPVWKQVLLDYENNNLQPKYVSQHTEKELHTVFNRNIFKGKKYFPSNLVQWGRGCKHNCDFCSIKSFYGNSGLLRPIQDVVNEIKTLDNKTIFFADDNLFHSRELFVEFLTQLIPLKKKWGCQISIDVTRDEELMKLMKSSGCVMALVGIETFNTDNLKQMNKSWNRSKSEYSIAIKKFRDAGIMVYGTFIFGYDFDTVDSFTPTVDFAIENKLFLANFNPLYPMPGTELYKRLKEENRLEFDKWWLHPDFYYGRTKFKPLSMTTEELEIGCFENKKKFNTVKSITYRLLDLKANASSIKNIVLFLLVNIVNRREIYRKQNQKLGQVQ
jgi:radical SAM superfamily enzyme YgiQ (UPF0313 family)